MKAFLWQGVKTVSSSYHSGGSVLIEAENVDAARDIAVFEQWDWETDTNAKTKMEGLDRDPDAIFESSAKEPKVWVFENAGCC